MIVRIQDFFFADPMSTRIVRVTSHILHRIGVTVGPGLLLLAGISLALAAGYVIPEYGPFVLALLVAGVLGVVSLLRPEVGLFFFTLMLFTRASENFTMSLGVPSIAPMFAAAMLSALVAREGLGTLFRTRRVYWIPIAVYGLVLLASVFVAVNQAIVLTTVNIYIKEAVFLAVIVLYARTIRDTRTFVWALLIAGLIPSALSIYQSLSGSTSTFLGFAQYSAQIVVPGEIVEVPRPSGQVGDPNFFALSLLLLIPLGLHRFRYERSALLRRLAMLTTLTMALAVILTYSRGAYIAMALMLVAAVFAGYIRLKTLVIALVVVALILPILPESYTGRLTSLFDIATQSVQSDSGEAQQTADSSYTGRMVQIQAGVNMFLDFPVLGVGTHNYPEYYQEYARPLGTTRRMNRTPHSLYVEIASETGLIGLTSFALLLGALSLWLRGVWNSVTQPRELRDLARAVAVSMTGYLVGSIFLHSAYPRYWWMLVAMILVTAVVSDERSRLRPAMRMEPIRRLDPANELRMRLRLRVLGTGVAIVCLAVVTVLIADARLEAGGVQLLPKGQPAMKTAWLPMQAEALE